MQFPTQTHHAWHLQWHLCSITCYTPWHFKNKGNRNITHLSYVLGWLGQQAWDTTHLTLTSSRYYTATTIHLRMISTSGSVGTLHHLCSSISDWQYGKIRNEEKDKREKERQLQQTIQIRGLSQMTLLTISIIMTLRGLNFMTLYWCLSLILFLIYCDAFLQFSCELC